MTTNTTNKTNTQYQPDQLKVKKRVQWDSKTISHLLQTELKQKCDVTIKIKLKQNQQYKHTKDSHHLQIDTSPMKGNNIGQNLHMHKPLHTQKPQVIANIPLTGIN